MRGGAQAVAHVAARFAAVWARLAQLADAADLPARAREHLAKAQRLTVPWQITFPTIAGNIAKVAFQAFVKNTTVDAPYDDKLGMSVSLQQTGSATWTYTTT